MDFLNLLWPYLLGGLVGWLASWWLAQMFKYPTENPRTVHVDKVVEKIVEVDKFVEVDRPALLARLHELEATVEDYEARLAAGPAPGADDEPGLLARISELEAELQAARDGPAIDWTSCEASGFKFTDPGEIADFTYIDGIGPKIDGLLHDAGISSYRQLANTACAELRQILHRAGPRYRLADPGSWPQQAAWIADSRWQALKDWKSARGRDAASTSQPVDIDAARIAGFDYGGSAGNADFTVIEGISPGIEALIHAAGIRSYPALADTDVSKLQAILDRGGPDFRVADPASWPRQAQLAAINCWDALRSWQTEMSTDNSGEKGS